MSDLPALTGPQLIRLLKKDGWEESRKVNHGQGLRKHIKNRCLVTVVPTKRRSLPSGTLNGILGPKQTKIGRDGLLMLIEKYGIK